MNAKQTNSDENPLTLKQETNFSVGGSHVHCDISTIVKCHPLYLLCLLLVLLIINYTPI